MDRTDDEDSDEAYNMAAETLGSNVDDDSMYYYTEL